ncbi:PhzF family phenazine biosynthesis protein [Hydrogenophaga sp.]|uniref:PhzF family phenazine biosynthesis protein n=1 Tax=Hydrogenophaga sp. TaxID=1904254 RepID=UPI003F71769A
MTMEIPYVHVSAFTDTPGLGNSAAVCKLNAWLADHELARLAQTIALPVTSFIVDTQRGSELRWLSRSGAFVQSMCGHGTLAAAFFMAMHGHDLEDFSFLTPGGEVPVRKRHKRFFLSLSQWNATPMHEGWLALNEALGATPVEVLAAGRDFLAVFSSEDEVRALNPDVKKLLALGRHGFIATAPGRTHDCVSRFFCPSFGLGVDEDPVTGSAHCSIAPLWAKRLGKPRIMAFQASSAGGELECEVHSQVVTIGASAVLKSHETVSI